MYNSSKSDMGRRAWNILRLALLWTRKGGVFALKKKLMQLQLQLSHSNKGVGSLQDGDRQLSFDATPIIHVRMHRPNSMRFHLPHIPCINPQAADAFDAYDFDDQSDIDYAYHQPRRSFLITNGKEHEQNDEEMCEEEGIDVKAEEFIANFYHQLKLQRQISYLQYNHD
ncbi:unnamed protein product [Lactuca saligna]|uniref:Uncharacterized protein n=1 Tax=Lactuca saligna TaxID=75948 RepID=A0AA35ZWV1_LACSI|nr:unnamed protein product [Lactuca saligna]